MSPPHCGCDPRGGAALQCRRHCGGTHSADRRAKRRSGLSVKPCVNQLGSRVATLRSSGRRPHSCRTNADNPDTRPPMQRIVGSRTCARVSRHLRRARRRHYIESLQEMHGVAGIETGRLVSLLEAARRWMTSIAKPSASAWRDVPHRSTAFAGRSSAWREQSGYRPRRWRTPRSC